MNAKWLAKAKMEIVVTRTLALLLLPSGREIILSLFGTYD